jgi:hypothetical protein
MKVVDPDDRQASPPAHGLEPSVAPALTHILDVEHLRTPRPSRFVPSPEIDSPDGGRLHAIGNQIFTVPGDMTFPDMLLDLLYWTLHSKWFDAQRRKPEGDRHQIAKWFDAVDASQHAITQAVGEMCVVPAAGNAKALLMLAHDVYSLLHAVHLPKRLLRRLRDRHGFQGAFYEIAVAAIFARQGFVIEYLDRREHKATKHGEFIATHRTTGARVVVEAKSRRRPGLLHQQGTFDPATSMRGDVGVLLDDALEKAPAKLPFVIFIDLNAPTTPGVPVREKPWWDELRETIYSRCDSDDADSFNAIIVTNWADHCRPEESAPRSGEAVYVISTCPQIPTSSREMLTAVIDEVQQHGHLPIDMRDMARIVAQHRHSGQRSLG